MIFLSNSLKVMKPNACLNLTNLFFTLMKTKDDHIFLSVWEIVTRFNHKLVKRHYPKETGRTVQIVTKAEFKLRIPFLPEIE